MILDDLNNKLGGQNEILDCSAELIKSAIHSALIKPINSLRQICGKSQLDWLKPDDRAAGAKAFCQQAGEMTGNIFDFMVLRKTAGRIAGESLIGKESANLATKMPPLMTAQSMKLSATTAFAQGYFLTPVISGNAGLFSKDRCISGIVDAGSMLTMDGTLNALNKTRGISQNFLGNLGRNMIAGSTGGASQILLSTGLIQHRLATGDEIGSATFGGAIGAGAFHTAHTIVGSAFKTIIKPKVPSDPVPSTDKVTSTTSDIKIGSPEHRTETTQIKSEDVPNPFMDAINEYHRIHGENISGLYRTLQTDHELVALKEQYSWALPDVKALNLIKTFAPEGIVEIMAGKGYWASLLQQIEIDVLPSDLHPVENESNIFHSGSSFTEVRQGNELVAAEHPEKTLMICWPQQYDEAATRGLKAYTEAGGKKLIYIGEPRRGQTADDSFFDTLNRHWKLIEKHELLTGHSVKVYEKTPEEITPEVRASIADQQIRSAQDKFDNITLKYGVAKGNLEELAQKLLSLDAQQAEELGLKIERDESPLSIDICLPDGSQLRFFRPYNQKAMKTSHEYSFYFENNGHEVGLHCYVRTNGLREGRMLLDSSQDPDIQIEVTVPEAPRMTKPQNLSIEFQDDYSSFELLPDDTIQLK